MNVGVIGGTFDPIHLGHLIIAEEARIELGLERVVFAPDGQPSLKSRRRITAAAHRLEMVKLAIAGNPHFSLSPAAVELPGLSYTVDLIRSLREGACKGAHVYFILGRDALADLPRWKEPQELVRLCRLVVAPRSGSRSLKRVETTLPGVLDRVVWLEGPVIGVSSTGIRKRVCLGLSIRYLVPAGVEQYIAECGLYAGMDG